MLYNCYRRGGVIKYIKIYQDLLKKIKNGEYAPGEQIPTEMEMVDTYEASRITIRNALQKLTKEGYIVRYAGRGSFVSETLTKRIKSNYVNFLAFSNEQQILEIISGAEEYLANYDLQIHIVLIKEKEFDNEILQILSDENSGGTIIYSSAEVGNTDIIEQYISQEHPVVFVDNQIVNVPCSCVTTDGFIGGYKAAEYFIENGHNNLGIFEYCLASIDTVRHRKSGFITAMRKHNLKTNSKTVLKCRNIEEAKISFSNWIEDNNLTAVFTINDQAAFIIYQVANELNLKIPEQISIIGFDDIAASSQIVPSLTTIEQPFKKIGKKAAELLIDQINGDKMLKKIYFPVELVKRQSVKDNRKKEKSI